MLRRGYCGLSWSWHAHITHHHLPLRHHVGVGICSQVVKTLISGVWAHSQVWDGASMAQTVLRGRGNGWSWCGDDVSGGEGVHWAGGGGAVHEWAPAQVHRGQSLISRAAQHTVLELDYNNGIYWVNSLYEKCFKKFEYFIEHYLQFKFESAMPRSRAGGRHQSWNVSWLKVYHLYFRPALELHQQHHYFPKGIPLTF